MKKMLRILVISSLLAAQALVLGIKPAHAATTWTVMSLADGTADYTRCPGASCSLRDALANAGAGDTIVFGVSGTIHMSLSDPYLIDEDLTISPGAGQTVTIDAEHLGRIFSIASGYDVTLEGFTLTHGLVNATNTPAASQGGGAILNRGNLLLNLMTIDDNEVACQGCNNNGLNGHGGGIASTTGSSLTITYSEITNNRSTHSGGGISFNSAGAGDRQLVLTGVKISNNQVTDTTSPPATGFGGGLFIGSGTSASLQKVTLSGNTAEVDGGGLWAGGLPLTVERSEIDSNHASGRGGGIFLSITAGTYLNLRASTMSGNSADGNGGGLYDQGVIAAISNSTFQGNSSSGANGGGGIYSAGTLTLFNATIAGNSASSGRAGGLYAGGTETTVKNTIMAGNTGKDCLSVYSWVSNMRNLLRVNDDSSLCPAPLLSSDPLLAGLDFHGGSTKTMPLLPGSPAMNQGDSATCADAATVNSLDQRGVSRPRGLGCDLGAFEFIPPGATWDPDQRTDPAVFEKATGNWFVVGSHVSFMHPALNFGNDTAYIPVPGTYDSDYRTDPAVFEKATGNWFAVGSTIGFFTPALNFGGGGNYIPVPGDYDADGKTDAAVFEKSTGNWFVVGTTQGFFAPALNFGNATDYLPVPGDYDGDGRTDPAVFAKSTGNWFVVGSSQGFFTPALNFGNDTGYIPVAGDYDGDGHTDPAVFERSTGNWFVVGSTAGFTTPALNFGEDTNYIPVPGDYDGDGRVDAAVVGKTSGNWFVVGSTVGFFVPALSFGNANYLPVVPSPR